MNQTTAIAFSILLVIAVIGFFINIYNKLVLLRFNIEKAYSNIDVVLKQRADEIPNLVSVARHYMNYEKEILTRLTELRSSYKNAADSDQKTGLANETTRALQSFFAVSENYPELKSNNNFLELQNRITELENKIADRREFFNDSVSLYNIGIHEFPNVIFARLLGYKNKTLLEIPDSEKYYENIQL